MSSRTSGILTIEQAVEAFAAEVAYWREVRGLSKKTLAKALGYTPSYVGHMESGRHDPSYDFAHRADAALKAGGAIERRGREYGEARERAQRAAGHAPGAGHASALDGVPVAERSPVPEHAHGSDHADESGTAGAVDTVGRAVERSAQRRAAEQPYATGSALVVEHETSRLDHDGSGYRITTRRLLRNVGSAPITRYLIRISVDRYPGEPGRSHAHYQRHPLTWAGLGLAAHCTDAPMRLVARHDRDAFKEVWLLLENAHGDFPLLPGDSAWIEYGYRVSAQQWGQWFQRAVRLPTKRLEVSLSFPHALDPVLWGIETSTGGRQLPLRTPPRHRDDATGLRIFSWSVATPPLHARYRMEWRFRARS